MRQKVHCLNNVCIYISIYTWTVKWQTSYLCDLQHDVSETRPFKLKAIFCTGHFPVKLRLLYQGVTARGLALYYEARRYKLELTGKSVKCRNALLWIAWYSFSKKRNFSLYMVVFLSIDTPLSQPLSLPTVFAEIRTAFHKNMCQFYVTHTYIYIYICVITETST